MNKVSIALLIIHLTCFQALFAGNPSLNDERVREIQIQSARFGTGLFVSDVTKQVAKLLRSSEEGFTVDNKYLKVDPRPYSRKCLVIDYSYRWKPYQFAVTSQQYVSYKLLLENTKK